MTADRFGSSDSIRSARPLRHAHTVRFAEPFTLELGGTLPAVTVCYETWGSLDAAHGNAVLVCHAISGDSHAAQHEAGDDPGWWDALIGPGKAIDTGRWFVICPNVLGGCRGTTGPGSIDPATGAPWGSRFPTITVGDMVALHVRLLDHLGVARLHAAVGGSLGGHQVLELATRFPERVAGAVALATSPHLTSQALAFDVVGRNAIFRDPQYRAADGDEAASPTVGLAIARMLGHITYLSREAMMEKFGANRLALEASPTAFERRFEVGSYLAHQGEKFVERFDANSYVTLSLAMDLFSLGETHEALVARFADPETEPEAVDPRSIFRARRIDYDLIVDLIDPGASVLDLGCGGGGLLARLASRGHGRLVGVERDEREIVTAVRRGLPVVQADLAEGLACFQDGEFDVVVLSQTLQAVRDVDGIVAEMLRVGRRCVVSFPNVGHEVHRRRLAEEGRAPVPSFFGAHRWYDTPDVRAVSIADFEDYCAERGIRVLRRLALDSAAGKRVTKDPNRNADVAVFVIAR